MFIIVLLINVISLCPSESSLAKTINFISLLQVVKKFENIIHVLHFEEKITLQR